jgi:hypothetical protein
MCQNTIKLLRKRIRQLKAQRDDLAGLLAAANKRIAELTHHDSPDDVEMLRKMFGMK